MTEKSDILVIGMGNVLMQDEGVGVRAVEELESRYILPLGPDGIEVMDGGTTGTELLEPMRGVKHLIVADAINTGAPAGSLVRLTDEQVPAFFQTKLSNHQLGLSDLLALLILTDDAPEHVTIIGMVPHYLENKLGLSKEANAGLLEMVDMIVAELKSLDVPLQERAEPLPCYWGEQAKLEVLKECA
ncbi:MAG: HyaD/HybD family hydrogenase maturation endopeptidase [Rhodospirillales bacterium]|jgi:hydrogenase maturation protease|nr:HyaD/HybD family hydrogenase maturation endopeptidase [Rhodospirillales bacterium]